jgi:hypothetical protein
METSGLEPSPKNTGKTAYSGKGSGKSDVAGVSEAAATPDPAFTILINAWPALSLAERKAIPAIARRASSKGERRKPRQT